MIYTCQHCGAWFDAAHLGDVIAKNENTIVCKYCGNVNEIGRMKTSHIAKGFDSLELGDFYSASMEFGEALKIAERIDISQRSPYLEAYLGHALAQFSVQVIYADEIADKNNPPEINCYLCNEMYIEDCREYQIAVDIARHIVNDEARMGELARIEKFAKIIDGIKKVYDKRQAEGTQYQLFLAYEDDSKDTVAGFTVANKIRNEMPSPLTKIFLPSRDDYLNDIEYEGEILYALNNSNCMLVITDNDIDARLMNMYSRYYWAITTNQSKFYKKDLGFVRFKNKIQIHLPDHKVSNNIFEIDDSSDYERFAFEANNLIYTHGKASSGMAKMGIIEESSGYMTESIEPMVDFDSNAPAVDGNICRFGSYPQRQVKDVNITSQFAAIPKPTMSNDNGWNVMFRSKEGKAYTWYLDREIGEKKYRLVYFMKFREVFTIRQTDLRPSVQRIANYMPMRIYVFEYEPVEWNILDFSNKNAVLVSSVGLDCREYNNCELTSCWECSSIKNWLNNDFMSTAFNDEQRKYLFTREDETISLIDSDIDFSKKLYRDKIESYNINGSDYLKCIGGFCDKNVSNFWIKNPSEYDDRAAALQPHAINNIVPQCVDNTAVSVVPKIMVRLVN